MIVTSFWPADGYGDTIAHFDIEVMDGLRLCGMRLVTDPVHGFRSLAPKMGTRRAATFHPRMASLITRAAVAHMKAQNDNDRAAA